jgi:cysteinyl-tRNA synthetase
MTHYREPIDWTVSRLQEAASKKTRWLGPSAMAGVPEKGRIPDEIVAALSDDLNTAKAFSLLDELAAEARSANRSDTVKIANDRAATMLWLGVANDADFAEARADSEDLRSEIRAAMIGVEKDEIQSLINARVAARKAKDFAEADRIRAELESMGIQLMDAKNPETGELVTTWEVKR